MIKLDIINEVVNKTGVTKTKAELAVETVLRALEPRFRLRRGRGLLAQDAYGHGPTRRRVTSLSGRVQHGNSGGPAVDGSGAVQSTVFAARAEGGGGYGVPASVVRRDLGRVGGPVSPGSCVG